MQSACWFGSSRGVLWQWGRTAITPTSNNGANNNAGPIILLVCLSRPASPLSPCTLSEGKWGVPLTKAPGLVRIKRLGWLITGLKLQEVAYSQSPLRQQSKPLINAVMSPVWCREIGGGRASALLLLKRENFHSYIRNSVYIFSRSLFQLSVLCWMCYR